MYVPPTNDIQRPSLSHHGSYQDHGSSTNSSAPNTPGTSAGHLPPQQLNAAHQGPIPPPNRRRGSSFGFGSTFFQSLTNTLRPSSSSSNLQTTNRSRAGSSSRLNLVQTANNSTPSIQRGNSLNHVPTTVPIVQNINNTQSSENVNDLYASTPTDDHVFQGQTRSNSLMNQPHNKPDTDGTYSIRLTPFIDHSSTSPALYFGPILRKTKPNTRLSIGRYTDKVREAAQAPPGSDAPIVFKSKVVSRTHAQFYVDDNGNWFIKDLKSSSGTFLNHIRLSPASIESEDTPIQNGDVLQLGMDFRGGVEDIFRCVKMRVEMNKSWQRKANQFNKEAHERLKSLALIDETELSECAICLLKVKPCQAVFISPCSHCWHYKCIRPIVVKSYPQFLCPNCRETCDLEADLEEEEEDSEATNQDQGTEEGSSKDLHEVIEEEEIFDASNNNDNNDVQTDARDNVKSESNTSDEEQRMMNALEEESN